MIQIAPDRAPKTASTPVFQTTHSPDSDVLIVSFSGLPNVKKNQDRPFDFFMTTKMLDYNRIMIRDPYDLFYLSGVDENGFEHLVERLHSEIQRIAAKKVIFIGASAGGYAAVLFGHLLGADYIHAFGTRGHFKLQKILRQGDIKSLVNRLPTIFRLLLSLPGHHRRFLDLKPLLKEPINPNPHTKTHLHACAFCVDASRAKYLRESPNTRVFLYPCAEHNVAAVLLKSHCLHAMLQKENLGIAEQIYENFYGKFDPTDPSTHPKKTKDSAALLLPHGSSPDGRFEVFAMAADGEKAKVHLEMRAKGNDKAIVDLGSSPLVEDARGYTLPLNAELLWNAESTLFALKMRDSKNSSRISCYKVTGEKIDKIPAPDFLPAIKRQLGFEFSGRFYFETPLQWETPGDLLVNVKGNTVSSIDPDGNHDFDYNFVVAIESGEILRIDELKRAVPPKP